MREPDRDYGLEIIGEAAFMLSLEFKEEHNEVPWNNIIRMRHVLEYNYIPA